MNSILTSIKQLLGIDVAVTSFDTDIMIHINSAIMVLSQLGIGPEAAYEIDSAEATWSDFLGDDKSLNAVRTFIYLKVRLIFDPPNSSFVIESINREITELSWRLNLQAVKGEITDVPTS